MAERTSIHGQWSSRLMFVLAASGSAIGLGNIWKFPYIAGENGGGAFVIVYLVCVAVIGVPVMMSELLIGRRGRQSPINTMRALAHEESRHGVWQLIGWAGMVAGFLIMSYYSVIAGWAVAYVIRMAGGVFVNISGEDARAVFGRLVSDPERLLAWHTIFIGMTGIVVARGVRSGLEQAVKIMMPALFVILFVLVGYAMRTDKFAEGLQFLFKPDFSKISAGGVLTAMGHAFFTLSLGMGAIMVYGSYMPKHTSIFKTSVIIALMDTAVALLAGMAIFPLVFANGLEPSAGPGLIFQTLPTAFGHMPGGVVFGTLFFVLVVFAAWTSAISLVEPAVAWLVENRGWSRVQATTAVCLTAWALGIVTIMSFSAWAFDFSFGGELKTNGPFDVLDILTANFMLPLGGLAMAVFAGWFMSRDSTRDELEMADGRVFRVWYVVVRYVTPVAVILVFLRGVGLIPLG